MGKLAALIFGLMGAWLAWMFKPEAGVAFMAGMIVFAIGLYIENEIRHAPQDGWKKVLGICIMGLCYVGFVYAVTNGKKDATELQPILYASIAYGLLMLGIASYKLARLPRY